MAPLLHFTGIDEIFLPVPSLERIALAKVAIAVWNLPQNRLMLDNFRTVIPYKWGTREFFQARRSREKNWEIIETKVRNLNKELMLPEILKNEVGKTIANVGREIKRWKLYHERRFEESQKFDVLLPSQLFWTAFGTIDRKKTAQALVKDSSLCVALRYKFACCYCLEKDIAELWKELPADYKINFESNHNDWGVLWSETVGYRGAKSLEHFWSCVMGGGGDLECVIASEHYQLISEFLMQQICFESNIAALQYFFTKFTQEVRDMFLEKIVSGYTQIDSGLDFQEVFFFLLSLLNKSQKGAMLAHGLSGYEILLRFIHWPWDTLFMPVAHFLRPILTPSEFVSVLCVGVSESDNEELFIECFEHSSYDFQQHAVEESSALLLVSFLKGNKRLIRMIWKLASVEKKADIINTCEKNVYFPSHIPNEQLKKSYENFFIFLIELSRKERKRNYLMKERRREEERNMKKI